MPQTSDTKAATIAEARRVCRAHRADGAFIVLLHRDGSISSASYGETKSLCARMKHLLNTGWDWLLGQEGE